MILHADVDTVYNYSENSCHHNMISNVISTVYIAMQSV